MLTARKLINYNSVNKKGEIMQITTITYGLTVNRGDYNSERLEMTGCLAEGDEVRVSLNELQNHVRSGLKLPTLEVPEGAVNETGSKTAKVTKKAAKKTTKKSTKKTTAKDESSVEGSDSKPSTKKPKESGEVTTSPEVESGTEREVPYTLEEVKDTLKACAKVIGMEPTKDIIRSYGVEKSNELPEDKFADIIKKLKKAAKLDEK